VDVNFPAEHRGDLSGPSSNGGTVSGLDAALVEALNVDGAAHEESQIQPLGVVGGVDGDTGVSAVPIGPAGILSVGAVHEEKHRLRALPTLAQGDERSMEAHQMSPRRCSVALPVFFSPSLSQPA